MERIQSFFFFFCLTKKRQNEYTLSLTRLICTQYFNISGAKGQLISKGLFGILEFLQKTNERIRF